MFERLKMAREEKLWCRAADQVASRARGANGKLTAADALAADDAGAAKVCLEKHIVCPSDAGDAVLERRIAFADSLTARTMRLVACAPHLSLPVLRRHADQCLHNVHIGPQKDKPGDALWALGIIATRRPAVFGARLGGLLAQLPSGMDAHGAITRAGVLYGVTQGLGAQAEVASLRATLWGRLEASTADTYPGLATLLAHHAWQDPKLFGTLPESAEGFHSLGLTRDFCETYFASMGTGRQDRLQMAEAMARTSDGVASDYLFEAITAVLRGEADHWGDHWARLLNLQQAEDWTRFFALAESLYDGRASGGIVGYFVGQMLNAHVAQMPTLTSSACSSLDAEAMTSLLVTCDRLTQIDAGWARVLPKEVQTWKAHVSRAAALKTMIDGRKHVFSPARHAVMGLVYSLSRPENMFVLADKGAYETLLREGQTVSLLTQAQSFMFDARHHCSRRTWARLRDALGDYLVAHATHDSHILVALGLFGRIADSEGYVDGRRVAAASRLLASLPEEAMGAMAAWVQLSHKAEPMARCAAFNKLAPVCGEQALFYLMEWICVHGMSEAMLGAAVVDKTWQLRLQNHLSQRQKSSWTSLNLDAWRPDAGRLQTYAEIWHDVVPKLESVNARDKARELLTFLMASEGPAGTMSVSNWKGDTAIDLRLAPPTSEAYPSMRAFCREANLKTPWVVNIAIGNARVVTHGELVPDISRFVALASDEIGRAMTVTWQSGNRAHATLAIVKLLDAILAGFACLDGWVTSLHEMIEKNRIGIDGNSLDMVLDLQNKQGDHARCSEYLRVFRLQCGLRYRTDHGLARDVPMRNFEDTPEFINKYCNAATFARHLTREHFAASLSMSELIQYQVDVVGMLERAA